MRAHDNLVTFIPKHIYPAAGDFASDEYFHRYDTNTQICTNSLMIIAYLWICAHSRIGVNYMRFTALNNFNLSSTTLAIASSASGKSL